MIAHPEAQRWDTRGPPVHPAQDSVGVLSASLEAVEFELCEERAKVDEQLGHHLVYALGSSLLWPVVELQPVLREEPRLPVAATRARELVQEHRPALLAERLRPRLGDRGVARRIAEPPPRQRYAYASRLSNEFSAFI